MGIFKDIFDYKGKEHIKFNIADHEIKRHPLIHDKDGKPRKKVILITRIVLILIVLVSIYDITFNMMWYKIQQQEQVEIIQRNQKIEADFKKRYYQSQPLIKTELQIKLEKIDSLKQIIKDSLNCNCPKL